MHREHNAYPATEKQAEKKMPFKKKTAFPVRRCGTKTVLSDCALLCVIPGN